MAESSDTLQAIPASRFQIGDYVKHDFCVPQLTSTRFGEVVARVYVEEKNCCYWEYWVSLQFLDRDSRGLRKFEGDECIAESELTEWDKTQHLLSISENRLSKCI